ncbi:hypothetical protein GCM10008955_16060 [Deinococcus malanensis]|uniref:Uncharacterized protein n=1 Tax=Deinococcus malanensis TaxID=1706855 RepID=A0ABQ2ERR5_9DEIO|nr:hypothetical protein [Deinococcus malanensis]GGK23282.1 hypothetical protein GCM10008955_16060 [Deinococcus malanensis]
MDRVLNIEAARRGYVTPQMALRDWLRRWQSRQYALMARHMPLPLRAGQRPEAAELRQAYPPGLLTFSLLPGYDTDAAVTVIPAVLVRVDSDQTSTQLWRFRMIHLDGAHQPLARDRRGGRWTLQSASVVPTPPLPRLQA